MGADPFESTPDQFQSRLYKPRLELDASDELNDSRAERRVDLEEVRAVYILPLTKEEIRMVEEVECFGAELKPQGFFQLNVLDDRRVNVEEGRAINEVALKVACLSRLVVKEDLAGEGRAQALSGLTRNGVLHRRIDEEDALRGLEYAD